MEFDTGEHPRGLSPAAATGVARETRARLVTGNAGDHKLVHALLRAANQAPSYEDFLAWLDEPTYEPTDRLLVKLGGQIVAHVQVLDRVAWFHGVKLPVGGVEGLATLPEYRDAGYERLLVAAAEQAMRDSQAVWRSPAPTGPMCFAASGWSEVGRPRFTEANVNDVLGTLAPSTAGLAARPPHEDRCGFASGGTSSSRPCSNVYRHAARRHLGRARSRRGLLAVARRPQAHTTS